MDKSKFTIVADGEQVDEGFYFMTAWVKALEYSRAHPDQEIVIIYRPSESVKARFTARKTEF
jgi:hypothetical protein